MKYQVPQFIEVEDKIFGPLTLKQFIYLAGGAGLSLAIFIFIHPLILSLLPIIVVLVFSGALAFYKVNNKPFVNFLEASFEYMIHPKLYIWQQEQKTIEQAPNKKIQAQVAVDTPFIPRLSDSKLKDMTWTLDTKGSLNPVTREEKDETSL